jgi:hypothetical protein
MQFTAYTGYRRSMKNCAACTLTLNNKCSEISSSHGGEYDVQSCLLGYTAV